MPIFRPFRHHGTALPSSAADRLTMCTFLVNWSSRSFWCAVGLFLPIHCLILVSHLFFPYSLVSRIFATVTQRNAANQVSGFVCVVLPRCELSFSSLTMILLYSPNERNAPAAEDNPPHQFAGTKLESAPTASGRTVRLHQLLCRIGANRR